VSNECVKFNDFKSDAVYWLAYGVIRRLNECGVTPKANNAYRTSGKQIFPRQIHIKWPYLLKKQKAADAAFRRNKFPSPYKLNGI